MHKPHTMNAISFQYGVPSVMNVAIVDTINTMVNSTTLSNFVNTFINKGSNTLYDRDAEPNRTYLER